MGRALQSRTWACGRRRRGATGASCWPGCATCTRAAWRTATSSPRTSCWTTTTTSRSPTSGWLRCSGTARASGCWRACAARCPTPRPRCWRRPRAPTAPRPPTCGPPRSCCSPCSSAVSTLLPAPLPRRARRPVGRRARAARHARRRSVPSSPRPSRAAPADLWAAALVLLAMLVGELPWERAAAADARWAAWEAWAAAGAGAAPVPFARLPADALALLRRALQPAPEARPALERLLRMRWLEQKEEEVRAWRSQPCAADADAPDADLSAADMDALLSHSQPAQPDDLLLASQHDSPGAQNELIMQRLVRRMTRVRLRCDEATALRALCEAARALGYTTRRLDHSRVAIECDAEVRMRAWAARAAGGALLELRRSRGCGLQFKRRYLRLRDALRPLAEPDD
ncbi:serine/threonine-protein kinase chk-1 isoform X6 [Ostrinia furnacalis]|uniref:serine/threonine-protein kinase chk-1 isoform X6 n=1 Tax=Ostrinia furnacalis TaxID=93504 RepID=UPI00103C774A|nr:serine/threonine-protein kinase chk-1 isoform X6 [Ostrinia furnacalis]XP_028170347.1 serine/threonine-protein kinase chk-1 isoform X6 [Ostrinia furnacalis]